MRLLIDANLSPAVASALNTAGFNATHVVDEGLVTAPDAEIVAYAAANELVIISADSDFGELLAASPGATRPPHQDAAAGEGPRWVLRSPTVTPRPGRICGRERRPR